MLRKIISIKNIGRFRNSAAPGNPEISQFTLISGANGYGKTTLCAVLRSLKTGDPAHITGRRRLGVEDPPSVELLVSDGQVRFDGVVWSSDYPALAIFDGVFVAENVHSGEVVEIDHRRNLYHVIIGEKGVSLAEEDASLAERSRQKTREIKAAAQEIQAHIPAGIKLDTFLTLAPEADLDARIEDQARAVEAARQVQLINDRPLLSEITIPKLPNDLTALLARTLDDISQDAETRVVNHLVTHRMEAVGKNWIAEGLEHANGENCPFCGQDIQGISLIASYRAVFSEDYKSLRDQISAMRHQIEDQFGEGAIGRLTTRAEENRGNVEFWGRFCRIDPDPLAMPDNILTAIRTIGQAAINLLDRKQQAPLEPVQPDVDFKSAADAYISAQVKAGEIAEAIKAVNALLATKKEAAGVADVQAAEAELARLRAIKVRHTDPVASMCTNHRRLTSEKDTIGQRKDEVRAQLNTHTQSVMRPYEQSINNHLKAFNAGFQLTETRHGYPGGNVASNYRLIINNTAIDLGDGRTPLDCHSFKNTLSSGDRTTLALAFFLANLEQDTSLSAKTVVFDDPFNSQDSFRRRQTVHKIVKIAQQCSQVIVLSHDATFLKQVWDKAPSAERIALTLADYRAQGTKMTTMDLERACQVRTVKDIDDLFNYINNGDGQHLDLIRKMRTVLETYCWTTYPACFQSGQDWLGQIVRKIRDCGDQHPARHIYEDLDEINDYTKELHHGEDLINSTPDQIDPQELTGYVKKTLDIVNGLHA